MRIDFLDAARRELADAIAWYDAQEDEVLGDRFLAEIKLALQRIVSFPTAWPKLSASTRRCRAARFPYGIVYQLRGDRILIVAVMHLHRNPDYWKDRI